MSEQGPIPSEIQTFLKAKHFAQTGIVPHPRSWLLKGSLPSQPEAVLFKIIPTATHRSLTQRNLVLWTQSLHQQLPANANFGIAPILDHGFIGEKYHWILLPFVAGEPFSVMQGARSVTHIESPQQYFPQIIELLKFIESARVTGLAEVDWRYGQPNRADKLSLLESLINLSRPETPHLSELLKIVAKNYANLRPCSAHGDFTETNIIIDPQHHPILIDAELGSGQYYKYYDVVEFYNRLFTRLGQPELAGNFLKDYVDSLSRSERARFLHNFLCLAAQRCIGNFFEIETSIQGSDRTWRLRLARELAEAIVSYRIIQFDKV